MKEKKSGRLRLLLLCWLAAAVLWLAVGGVRLGLDAARRSSGSLAARTLNYEDCVEVNNLAPTTPWGQGLWLLSYNGDPQLIWELGGQAAGLLTIEAEAVNRPGGEMVLYYTTAEGEAFSENKKLWALQDEAGRWVFDLGGRRVQRLRWDPDSRGSIIWQVGEIRLGDARPAYSWFVPDMQQALLLLLMPVLCWGVLCEAWAFASPAVVRRRFESRWKDGGGPAQPKPAPGGKG